MLHKFIRIACAHCGDDKFVPAPCGDRFCPVCSKSARIRVRWKLDLLTKKIELKPGQSLKHIILTIKNTDDLINGVKHLLESFRRLRQQQFWLSRVEGGAAVIEVTRKARGWHPHLHIVVQSYYIPQDRLSTHWKTASGSDNVFVKRIPPTAAVHYLTKYMTKGDVSPENLPELNAGLKGTRMFIPFGIWHGFQEKLPKFKATCQLCMTQSWMILDYGTYKDSDKVVIAAADKRRLLQSPGSISPPISAIPF